MKEGKNTGDVVGRPSGRWLFLGDPGSLFSYGKLGFTETLDCTEGPIARSENGTPLLRMNDTRVQHAVAETSRLVVLESAAQKARGKDNSRLRRIWYGTEYWLNVGWELMKIVFAICATLAAWGVVALVGLAIIKWAVEELSR